MVNKNKTEKGVKLKWIAYKYCYKILPQNRQGANSVFNGACKKKVQFEYSPSDLEK